MTELQIITEGGATWFKPGGQVAGELRWSQAEDDSEALELRLFWYTSGKGTDDVGVVACQRIEGSGRSGSRRFSFDLPEGPYSFTGKLITLAWALELEQVPSGEVTRLDIRVGPTADEIHLRRGARTC